MDIVHLRCDSYSNTSRIPTVTHGAPLEDALRRDLTINSLFYNLHTRQVEDFTGKGFADLRAGLVRTPLPPLVTLLDDPLRVFRAVRFASKYQFRIEPELVKACSEPSVHEKIATKISPERCSQELKSMISGHAVANSFARMHRFGLLDSVLKIPSTLTRRVDTPRKNSYGMLRTYVPVEPAQIAQLRKSLFPVGMSTFMIAHYMRQICGNPPAVLVDSASAIGKLANFRIPSKFYPLMKSFLNHIQNRDDWWEIFT